MYTETTKFILYYVILSLYMFPLRNKLDIEREKVEDKLFLFLFIS